MTRKIKQKIVAIFMLFGILLTSISSVFALGNNKAENNDVLHEEAVSSRSEYEKHFINEDGTYTAASYAYPVHYKNENGRFVDIDNTLIKTENGFVNKDNPMLINLARSTKNNLVGIKLEDYELNWNILNIQAAEGKVIENGEKLGRTDIQTIKSKIAYDNIFKDTNLVYKLSSYSLSEDIIFSKVPTYDKVVYNIETKNLVAKLVENEVVFYDVKNSEKEVFRFEAPFMFDSAEKPVHNENIKVVLDKTEKGYTLTHVIDMKWLEAEERVYPVVLDPTVKSYQHYSNIEDTYTNSNNSNTNYVNNKFIQVGKYQGNNYGFIKITNMPSVPANATVVGATLEMFLNYGSSSWGALEVLELRNAWNSYTLKWNNQAALVNSSGLVSNGIYPVATGGYQRYGVGVTSTVQKWYNGTMANWGFLVRYQNPNHNDFNWIYSSDHTTIGGNYLPAITVDYNAPNDYENMNWAYPLPAAYTNVTQGWHSTHHGIDIGVPVGQPIYAAQSGVISSVLTTSMGYTIGNGVALKTDNVDPGTGNNIIINYGHLSSIAVYQGQRVNKGDVIAYSGNTGSGTGPHLQIEINKYGINWASHTAADQYKTINPILFWPWL